MVWKLVSYIHIANMKPMRLWIPKLCNTPTKITGRKLEMRILGVVSYLRTKKNTIPFSIKNGIGQMPLYLKETNLKYDLTCPDLDPKLAEICVRGLYVTHHRGIRRCTISCCTIFFFLQYCSISLSFSMLDFAFLLCLFKAFLQLISSVALQPSMIFFLFYHLFFFYIFSLAFLLPPL